MYYNLKERAKYYFNILHSALLKDSWQNLNHCDILLVRHDNNCGYTFQGKAYAHLIDTFGDICTKHSLSVRSIAKPYSILVGKRAYNFPVSYNRAYLLSRIIGTVLQTLRGHSVGTAWVDSRRVDLWCQILEKATPRCVIGILPDEHLCRAGKIKKIPVYDLQHGVIADEHPWYGEKYRSDTPIDKLPDGFLCWDDQSVAVISKWAGNKGIHVINVGNPWFLRFATIQPEDLLVHEAIAEGDLIDDSRPCIVVSLQWGLETDYPDKEFNGVIVDALEKVILDTIGLYNWVLRLHPVQMRDIEKERVIHYLKTTFGAEKTRKWLTASEIPLPVLLSKADLHITDCSTVVIEAGWMGIRSGLLSEQLNQGGKYQSYFSYERSIGMADVLPQNPEIIKKWIIESLRKGRGGYMLKHSHQSFNNFINEIARI